MLEDNDCRDLLYALSLHFLEYPFPRPAQRIDVPYEVTISSAMRDSWQSAFFTHDRMFTSTPFARVMQIERRYKWDLAMLITIGQRLLVIRLRSHLSFVLYVLLLTNDNLYLLLSVN